MGGEWTHCTVGEVAVFNPESYSPTEDWEFVNYLDTGNITAGVIESIQHITNPEELPTRARRKVRPGDIVYSTVRPNQRHYGIITSPLPNMLVSTGFAVIRARSRVCDTRYLYYVLTQARVIHHLHSIADNSRSAYPSITAGDIEALEIDLPPLPEQRAIAHILGTLDDRIQVNRRMSETLEALARALFKSWFVDFDPVRAKCRGARPGASGSACAQQGNGDPPDRPYEWPRHILDLFPDRLVPSEIGMIPEGWSVGKLGDVADNPRRSVLPHSIGRNTAYIALEHMPKRSIVLSEWGNAQGLESSKLRFEQGEILFGKLRPYFHKVGVAPVEGVCSTDIVVIKPRQPAWFGFVLGHVSSDRFVEYADATSTGTKMPRVGWSDMAGYSVALPHARVAEAFSNAVQPCMNGIIAATQHSRTLAALRDALLPKLISGRIRVRDAERFLEERGL